MWARNSVGKSRACMTLFQKLLYWEKVWNESKWRTINKCLSLNSFRKLEQSGRSFQETNLINYAILKKNLSLLKIRTKNNCLQNFICLTTSKMQTKTESYEKENAITQTLESLKMKHDKWIENKKLYPARPAEASRSKATCESSDSASSQHSTCKKHSWCDGLRRLWYNASVLCLILAYHAYSSDTRTLSGGHWISAERFFPWDTNHKRSPSDNNYQRILIGEGI